MKHPITLLLLLSILAHAVHAQSVSDVFKRIPPQSFTEGTPDRLIELAASGQGIIDSDNEYIRLDGDGAQVSLQVALFRYQDNSPLLIVTWGNLEEPEFTHLTLFKEVDGKMVMADRNSFPVMDSDKIRFELSRHGRSIIVRDPEGVVISQWTWNGIKFLELK